MPLTNELVDYCSDWPQKYLAEKHALQRKLRALICSIHHIGSTAIPGMMAKPEIDILIIVKDLTQIDIINSGMESLGYRVRGECGIAGRHYYSKDTNGVRTHKAHVYKKGHRNIWAQFAFRDYLIAHPDLAAEYGELKKNLARENTRGMGEYCDGKDDFVKVLLLAEEQERNNNEPSAPIWLDGWMKDHNIDLWGAADLADFPTPLHESGQRFPIALSWVVPMNPHIMASIQNGPNPAYADEYARVNHHIDELSSALAAEIKFRGFRSQALAASDRTDTVNIKGDFPHKTAATRAGLGWVGRHCQLVTRPFGPWVRLGTVFTDIELVCGSPIERSFCGRCMRCVEACPAKALKGHAWYPGLARDEILDARACDQWKKKHYFQYHEGHNCGICSSVCPFGSKILKKKTSND